MIINIITRLEIHNLLETPINILLLDDDLGDQLLFQNTLNKVDYERPINLFKAGTPQEAYDHFNQQTCDLAFIDYNLGSTTGMDFIKSCVQKFSDIPFILLTGTDRPELYKLSSELNVYDYLLKNELSPSLLSRSMVYTLQRKSVEHDLIIQKDISSSVINSSPDMIVELDHDYKIVSYNPTTKDITGYGDSDLINQNFLSFYNEYSKPFIQSSLKSGDMNSLASEVITKSGGIKTVHWTLLKGAKTDVTFFVLGHDMTEQIEQEKQYRQDEKIKALGHLAGGVAHEINNLLQPVILNAELLKDALYEREDQEILSDIFGNAKLAANIVEDILIFARQDMKSLHRLNFLDTFDGVIKVCKKTIDKTIEIKVINDSVAFDALSYMTHEDLTRTILNLIKNASDSMNNEGVIKIHLTQENDYICIDIIDQGCGIPKKDQEVIFNAFYTTKPIGQGTGLGLTMVYNLVKGWGGTISLKSEEGKGSTFTLQIPTIVD